MFDPDEYELVDFGAGRKLERFGRELLDRPSPAAESVSPTHPRLWSQATARFDVERAGKGRWSGPLAEALVESGGETTWSARHGDVQLELQLRPSGNIGVFPEHASTWDWIGDEVRRRSVDYNECPRVLNLFAYTGGASLTAAIAGAEVTHVDSSGPTVAWAKRNAETSGASELPIRWLVDDAMKFIVRECRRGNYYDGIIADPPTYGHGPKGRPFKFSQHLDALLKACGQMLANPERPYDGFLLFSCHAPGFGMSDAVRAVSDAFGEERGSQVSGLQLSLVSADGRKLGAGTGARSVS